jgi:hypothetical protein
MPDLPAPDARPGLPARTAIPTRYSAQRARVLAILTRWSRSLETREQPPIARSGQACAS